MHSYTVENSKGNTALGNMTAQKTYSEVPIDPDIRQPEFTNLHDRLSKANAEQSSLLYEIEEKLHCVLNLRTPPSDKKGIERPEPNDFTQAMNKQLDSLAANNDRLNTVLNHIKKLVG